MSHQRRSLLLPDMPGTSEGLIDAFPDPASAAFAFSVPRCDLVPPTTTCLDPTELRFNSHKGPMTAQTLAGMNNHGSMHWRGDRTIGSTVVNVAPPDPAAKVQPNGGMFNERASFIAFNVAFPGLVGRDTQIPQAQMEKFADFMLQNTLPPNPIHNLDNSLTGRFRKRAPELSGGRMGRG